jgi:hypothetical protein
LIVYPLRTRWSHSEWRKIDVKADNKPFTIELPQSVARTVVVRTSSGQPVAGAVVDLVVARTGPGPSGDWSTPLAQFLVKERNATAQVRLARGRTNEAGTVRLFAPAHERPVELRVEASSFRSASMRLPSWTTDPNELRVGVELGARLAGTVTPVKALDRLDISTAQMRKSWTMYGPFWRAKQRRLARPCIAVRYASEKEPEAARVTALADDGSFTIDGLPPGDCTIGFLYWRKRGERSKFYPLARARLVAGRSVELALEVPAPLRDERR